MLRERCPWLGGKTEIAEGLCSLVGQGLMEVGVGWNLGTGGGISPGQVDERQEGQCKCAKLVGGVAGR